VHGTRRPLGIPFDRVPSSARSRNLLCSGSVAPQKRLVSRIALLRARIDFVLLVSYPTNNLDGGSSCVLCASVSQLVARKDPAIMV